MNTKNILRLCGALLLGNMACGSDPAPESTGPADAEGADDETDEEAESKPAVRDAGTQNKDAGKPARVDPEQGEDEDADDEADTEADTEQGPARAVDAGKKPAVVDAGHVEHVGSEAVDAGSRPTTTASAGAAARTFCGKYEMYCGYGKMNRHADEKACLADFEATPIQQGCKVMHLDTSIAGTAAACNGMQSAFCFSIHCLHATGITDPTGVTYCK